jgi:hypothetical protein
MSASLLSSFLIFLFVGAWETFWADKSGTWFGHISDDFVIDCIRLSIWANAIYFYYCAALVELHQQTRTTLQTNGSGEWITRLFNQTMILGLWPAMHHSLVVFASYMLILYLTFIIWGFQTHNHLPPTSKFVRWFDAFGGTISLVLIVDVGFFMSKFQSANNIAPIHWTIIGILCCLYIVVAVIGCSIGFRRGFNPLSPEYYTRQALH